MVVRPIERHQRITRRYYEKLSRVLKTGAKVNQREPLEKIVWKVVKGVSNKHQGESKGTWVGRRYYEKFSRALKTDAKVNQREPLEEDIMRGFQGCFKQAPRWIKGNLRRRYYEICSRVLQTGGNVNQRDLGRKVVKGVLNRCQGEAQQWKGKYVASAGLGNLQHKIVVVSFDYLNSNTQLYIRCIVYHAIMCVKGGICAWGYKRYNSAFSASIVKLCIIQIVYHTKYISNQMYIIQSVYYIKCILHKFYSIHFSL